jgi:hypothetical protein
MRLRVAKKVAKRHHEGAYYRQTTLDRASTRLKLKERLQKHILVEEEPTPAPVKETPVKAVQTGPDYTSMSVADLKAAAKEQGLKGYSKMKKAELIDLLQS